MNARASFSGVFGAAHGDGKGRTWSAGRTQATERTLRDREGRRVGGGRRKRHRRASGRRIRRRGRRGAGDRGKSRQAGGRRQGQPESRAKAPAAGVGGREGGDQGDAQEGEKVRGEGQREEGDFYLERAAEGEERERETSAPSGAEEGKEPRAQCLRPHTPLGRSSPLPKGGSLLSQRAWPSLDAGRYSPRSVRGCSESARVASGRRAARDGGTSSPASALPRNLRTGGSMGGTANSRPSCHHPVPGMAGSALSDASRDGLLLASPPDVFSPRASSSGRKRTTSSSPRAHPDILGPIVLPPPLVSPSLPTLLWPCSSPPARSRARGGEAPRVRGRAGLSFDADHLTRPSCESGRARVDRGFPSFVPPPN